MALAWGTYPVNSIGQVEASEASASIGQIPIASDSSPLKLLRKLRRQQPMCYRNAAMSFEEPQENKPNPWKRPPKTWETLVHPGPSSTGRSAQHAQGASPGYGF